VECFKTEDFAQMFHVSRHVQSVLLREPGPGRHTWFGTLNLQLLLCIIMYKKWPLFLSMFPCLLFGLDRTVG
jgi:hypothetical protein